MSSAPRKRRMTLVGFMQAGNVTVYSGSWRYPATDRIGIGATYSTTYYAPFHVARTFATLDHLSRGRAAWNVVTSVNDSEAQNYGFTEVIGHDERYDRADEFLEATTGLWDTWEDDALVLDRTEGVFADPEKVHELGYEGEWFS